LESVDQIILIEKLHRLLEQFYYEKFGLNFILPEDADENI
jgi:hypothetical protein